VLWTATTMTAGNAGWYVHPDNYIWVRASSTSARMVTGLTCSEAPVKGADLETRSLRRFGIELVNGVFGPRIRPAGFKRAHSRPMRQFETNTGENPRVNCNELSIRATLWVLESTQQPALDRPIPTSRRPPRCRARWLSPAMKAPGSCLPGFRS
jgi:hypothetical protein